MNKNKFMTSTKFSNEEMNLLNELLNHIEAIDKISQKLKSMNTNHEEVGLTADMWSEQSKKYLELFMESFIEDRGAKGRIN